MKLRDEVVQLREQVRLLRKECDDLRTIKWRKEGYIEALRNRIAEAKRALEKA